MKKKSQLISISVLFFAHMINDLYANFLPNLTAVLIASQVMSIGAGVNIVAAFTITSSIAQPVFGYLIDQKGQRWLLYVGTLWMSILLSLTGIIHIYTLLFFIAALAGLGTAAFHPQAAALVGKVGTKNKGLIMSAFIAMGNMGMAVSPLLLLPIFKQYGVQYTWLAIFPGILASILLYRFAPRQNNQMNNSSLNLREVFIEIKKSSKELIKILLVVAMRSSVSTGLATLLPLYFLAKNISIANTSYLMFLTLASGAIGGVIGGFISDRYGRKLLIICSLILASLSFFAFFTISGFFAIIFLVLGEMSLLSSFSVTVVIAQEIIPKNAAFASGLSLGFSIGIGGLAISFIGSFAQRYGIHSAIGLLFAIPMIAGLFAIFLKEKNNKTDYEIKDAN